VAAIAAEYRRRDDGRESNGGGGGFHVALFSQPGGGAWEPRRQPPSNVIVRQRDRRRAGASGWALGATEQWRPELIVRDLMLPDLDGFEVARRVRSTEGAGVHLTIIFLSARDTTSGKVRGSRLGTDDYATKPFRIEALVERAEDRDDGRAPHPFHPPCRLPPPASLARYANEPPARWRGGSGEAGLGLSGSVGLSN
jgi:CheY-like chemotaxis protein